MRSWTACHFDTPKVNEKLSYLKSMLCSVMVLGIHPYISIYGPGESRGRVEELAMELENEFSMKVHLYFQEERKLQFEHLDVIRESFDGDLDEKILFMDDDDIMLHLPKEFLPNTASEDKEIQDDNQPMIVMGLQHHPESFEGTMDAVFSEIGEVMATNTFTAEVDFSGYMAPFRVVSDYFKRRDVPTCDFTRAASVMEDCTFMDYLDSLGARKPTEPFVFRRIYETNDRGWTKIIFDVLDSKQAMFQRRYDEAKRLYEQFGLDEMKRLVECCESVLNVTKKTNDLVSVMLRRNPQIHEE